MESAHMPAITIQSALTGSPRDDARTAMATTPRTVTAIQSSFLHRLMAIKVPEAAHHASLLSGSALVSSAGNVVSTLRTLVCRIGGRSRRLVGFGGSPGSFRRNAETSTRDECATRDGRAPVGAFAIDPRNSFLAGDVPPRPPRAHVS